MNQKNMSRRKKRRIPILKDKKKKSNLGVDGVKSQRSRIHGGRGRGRRKRAIENRGGGQETRLDNLLWAVLIGTGEAEERFGSLGHESPHFLYTPDDPVRRVMEWECWRVDLFAVLQIALYQVSYWGCGRLPRNQEWGLCNKFKKKKKRAAGERERESSSTPSSACGRPQGQ